MPDAPAPALPVPPTPTPTPEARDALASRWSRRLAALAPWSIVFSPVFHREIRSTSRAASSYWTRFAVTLTLLGLATLVYIGAVSSSDLVSGSGVARFESLQRVAPAIFYPVAWLQFAVIVFVAIGSTSPAINRERQRRTFPVLATTPLTAAQIIFGTLAARLAQIFILTLLIVPFLLALRVFGGLELSAIIHVASLTIAAGVLGAALGILGSVLFAKPTTANSLAVGAFILWALWPVIGGMLWYRFVGPTPPPLWPAVGSPVLVLAFATAGTAIMPVSPDTAVTACVGVNLALALVVALVATARARPLVLREAATEGQRPAPRKGMLRRLMGSSRTAEAPREPSDGRASSRTVSDRPVLWRELRASAGRWTLVRIVLILLVGLIVVSVNIDQGLGSEESVQVSTMVFLAWFLLSATSATTGAVTSEVEQRTWDALLTTPLTGREILTAKIFGGLRRLWVFPVFVLIFQAIGLLAGNLDPRLMIVTLCAMGGAGIFLATSGVLLSLRAAQTARANSLNLLLAFALWAGSLIVIGLLGWILDIRREPWPLGIALLLNPIGLVAMPFDAMLGRFRPTVTVPGVDRFNVNLYVALAIAHLTVYALFARLLLAWASARWTVWSIRRLA